MATIPGLTINESTFPLKNGGVGKIAVFIYAGDGDPSSVLDWAVADYTKDCDDIQWNEFIDANMNCPWVRVIISHINDMEQYSFYDYMVVMNRDRKIDNIIGDEANS